MRSPASPNSHRPSTIEQGTRVSMPTVDDDLSIRELARTLSATNATISDFRNEFRAQISQLIRQDVYRAEQQAMEFRIASLERDRERDETERQAAAQRAEQERAASRRQINGALLAAGLSFATTIVMFIITLAVK